MTQSELATGIKVAYDLADDLETWYKAFKEWIQRSPLESSDEESLLLDVHRLLVQVRTKADVCLSAHIQALIDSRST